MSMRGAAEAASAASAASDFQGTGPCPQGALHSLATYLCSSAQLPLLMDTPVNTMLQGWHQAGFIAQKSCREQGRLSFGEWVAASILQHRARGRLTCGLLLLPLLLAASCGPASR